MGLKQDNVNILRERIEDVKSKSADAKDALEQLDLSLEEVDRELDVVEVDTTSLFDEFDDVEDEDESEIE